MLHRRRPPAATRTTSPATPSRRGEPEHGAELADELERLVALHDASTIAAVIVEPVAGSTGVLIPPKGYLQAPARHLRQARHPADLRRGHHRLRPPRHALRRRLFRRHRPTSSPPPRASPTAPSRWARCSSSRRSTTPSCNGPEHVDRALPRLHLFGPPGRLRRRPRHARHLQGGGAAHPRRRARAVLGRCAALAEGPAARHRHPQHRPRSAPSSSSRSPARRRKRALRAPSSKAFETRPPDPHHRRHHRAVAAAHHREEADRPARSTCSPAC